MLTKEKGIRLGQALLALLLVVALLLPMIPANYVLAEDVTYDVGEYKGDKEQAQWTYPTQEGKAFAGWYADAAFETPYTETTGQAYAKFVDSALLGVKKQLSTGATLASETVKIRFVTAIDSLDYASVTFDVKVPDLSKTWALKETTAYTSILVSEKTTLPSEVFGSEAKYFVLHSLTGIPKAAYEAGFEVNVIWETLDGTLVSSAQANTFTVKELIAGNCAHTNTERRNAKTATCDAAGYTGDTYCTGCEKLLTEGEAIEATGNHNYVKGVCSGCGAADPDYVAPPVAPTEDTDGRWIYKNVLTDGGTWTYLSTDGTANTASLSDGKLQITDDADTVVSAYRGLKTLTGEVVVEFEVTASALSTNSGLYFTLGNGGTIGADVRLFSDGVDCYTTKNNKVAGTYTADTTYKMQIVADVDSQTYDVFIDGNLTHKDVAMRNTVANLNRVRFYTTTADLAATVTYENLKIYYLDPICDHTNTEVRDAEAATCGAAGYTGDTYCTDCDMKLAAGETITATGEHTYVYGICSVCAAANPDCKAPVTPTEDTDNRWIYQNVLTDGGTWTYINAVEGTANTASLSDGKLQITDDASTVVSAYRGLKDLTGEVVVEFEVSSTMLSKTSGLYFTLGDGTTIGSDVRLFSDGVGCYAKNTVNKTAGSYEAGTTYKVQIVADVKNNTYDVFVAGKLTHENVEMRNTVTKLTRVRFYTTTVDLAATVTYENLKIYYLNEVCTHTNTEVRDEKAATCGAAGYTGDTYCADCDVLVSKGETIDATGAHNYAGGTCGVCGATDPDYVAPPVAPTESTDSRWIYQNVLTDGGSWSTIINPTDADTNANYISLSDGKLQITDDADTVVSAYRGLKSLEGVIVVEFDVSSTALSENSALYFALCNDSTVGADVRMFSNGIDCYTTQNNKVSGTYEANETYKVQIVVNTTDGTYDVFVGGILTHSGLQMRNSVKTVNRVRFYTTSKELVATVTYENLKIYYLNEPTAE